MPCLLSALSGNDDVELVRAVDWSREPSRVRVVRLSVLSVCNVGVLWPNGWMDQDETWHAGRPRPRPHCVRWGPSSPSTKNVPVSASYAPPTFVTTRSKRMSECCVIGPMLLVSPTKNATPRRLGAAAPAAQL